jgi:predicted nucleic acid-binding protein
LVIVADSSYIVEGLLSNKELLSRDQIITSELSIYETANTIWKHEFLLKSIQNGGEYLTILYGLIDSGRITVISSDQNLIQAAYLVAKSNGITPYDAIFVCMALKLQLALKTLDEKQSHTFEIELRKGMNRTEQRT